MDHIFYPNFKAVPVHSLFLSGSRNGNVPFKKRITGAPGWLSRLSVRLRLRLQLRPDLMVRGFEPRVGLCADSSEPGACFELCVSL